jgi:hypothetical protein
MSIQEFHSQLASDREKAPLLLALRRLSLRSDLKGLARAASAGGWGEWPVGLNPRSAIVAA